jgi:hypothetical protein
VAGLSTKGSSRALQALQKILPRSGSHSQDKEQLAGKRAWILPICLIYLQMREGLQSYARLSPLDKPVSGRGSALLRNDLCPR